MSQIGKNIWFASLGTLIPSIFTYFFWFLTARWVGAYPIGIASAIGSITIIFATLVVLDVSLGMKRSLGIAFSTKDLSRFKQILVSGLILVSIATSVACVLLFTPQLRILQSLGIDSTYSWILIAMVPALSFQYVFTEALISSFNSKQLVIPLTIGAILRFPILFVILYFFSKPIEASVVAYSSLIIVPPVFYAIYLLKFLPKKAQYDFSKTVSDLREIIPASLASWFPHMVNVLGSQLGIITVFTFGGSSEGGLFYIPMAIYSVVLFLTVGINKVSHPLVAGMNSKTQQIDLLNQLMKLAYVSTMPIMSSLLFFSSDFLNLLGSEFRNSSIILSIMMWSVPLAIISEMVFYHLYGLGQNKMVLYLGLFGNIPRIVLYFLLIPPLGGVGAAIAYFIGSIFQLLLTVVVEKNYSLNLAYKNVLLISTIPLAVGLFAWIFQMNYLISFCSVLTISIIMYIRLHIVTPEDILTILSSCLPQRMAVRMKPWILFMVKKLS